MKEETRLVDGATHTDSSTTKNNSGMSMYCLNDRDDRLGTLRSKVRLSGGRG
jgi:hypothetical protein